MKRFVVLVAFAGPLAAAQPAPDLVREFQAGVDAFRLGHYDEARQHLLRARDMDPKLPGPHRFLAAIAHKQGAWQACIDEARLALELNPKSQELAETRKLHDACRVAAGRAPFPGELGDGAAIAVSTTIAGASVKIGGLVYGATPLAPRPIPAGELELDVDKAGWKPVHLHVTALPGIVTDVAIALEPEGGAATVELAVPPRLAPTTGSVVLRSTTTGTARVSIDGQPAPPPDDAGRVELAPGTHVIEIDAPAHDRWRRRVRVAAGQQQMIGVELVDTATRERDEHRGLALLGGGAAIAAFGFAAALVSESAAAEARDIVRVETARPPGTDTSGIEPIRTRADLDAARSRASTWGLASNLAYGAAAVAAGAGAIYLYLGARERTDQPPPFAVAPAPGGVVVGKELRW